jgi:hypothetical protein
MFRATQPTFLALLVLASGLCCQEPGSRPTTRDDPAWEKGLKQAAAKLIASKKTEQWRRDYSGATYGGSTRLRHPLLEKYFPDRRFYFVQLRVPDPKVLHNGILHDYRLTILKTKDKTGTTYRRGDLKALDYLKANDVRARTGTQAVEIHELRQILVSLCAGSSQPHTPLSKKSLYKRHGLGFPKPQKPNTQRMTAKAVEAGSRRYAVACWERCDDWNMPVTLSYRLLAFDKKTGKLLGMSARRGKTFANKDYNQKVREREYAAFLKELAQEKD